MADTVHKPDKGEQHAEDEHHEEAPLKGTFVSVMILGGFLVLTWLLVFILFIARN